MSQQSNGKPTENRFLTIFALSLTKMLSSVMIDGRTTLLSDNY